MSSTISHRYYWLGNRYYRFSNRYYRSAFSWYILGARGEAPLSASFVPTPSTRTRAAAGALEAAGALPHPPLLGSPLDSASWRAPTSFHRHGSRYNHPFSLRLIFSLDLGFGLDLWRN